MALSGSNEGNVNDLMVAGVGTDWQTFVSFGNKTGRNTWGYDNLGNVTEQVGDYAQAAARGSRPALGDRPAGVR